MKLPNETKDKLAKAKIFLVKDLFVRSRIELTETMDATPQQIASLFATVAAAVAPKPKTALNLLQACKATDHFSINLGTEETNFKIGKGLTELVGPAGVGKTQFCLTLCVESLVPGKRNSGQDSSVLYIDTESTFSPSRIIEIAQKRYPDHFSSPAALQDITSNIIVFKETKTAALLERLMEIETNIIERNVQLLIVDSIAHPVRMDFDNSCLPQRQQMLSKIACQLKFLGETFGIPIVVTNQIMARFKDDNATGPEAYRSSITAALGVSWAHAVNTRLVLDQGGRLSIAKSPQYPPTVFNYQISSAGTYIQGKSSGS